MIEIKAVKFRRDGYYTQPLVFGGEEGPDKFDHNIRYCGSLQNYLIDTGTEVILVDTGLPAGFPDAVADEKAMDYLGRSICDYMEALAARCSRDAGPHPVSSCAIIPPYTAARTRRRATRTLKPNVSWISTIPSPPSSPR